jgi:DNA-binding response OmpR family regulator
MKKIVFVIDDEQDIQEIIKINLNQNLYQVYTFSSAEEADKKLQNNVIPDIMVLDIMMDGMDGYDFCKYIRASSKYKDIPIIFLSAKTEELDKILGLELGGDDYLTKPFSVKELVARIKAILRRFEKSESSDEESKIRKPIIYKGLTLSPEEFSLTIDNNNVKLTKTEFEMLHLFLSHPNKVFSRNNIIDSVRGSNIYVVDRTIDVHIKNLRKKLDTYKDILSTYSGVGYGFKKND